MTLWVPVLYHWSPIEARANIVKRGLLARTPTHVAGRPYQWKKPGHHLFDDDSESVKAVRLGVSPSVAWRLSACFAERGRVFDLWEVDLSSDDEVHPRAVMGYELDEVAVLNDIPRTRIWWGGSRVVGARRLRSNPDQFAIRESRTPKRRR